ncbi:histidine N-acetyltransferase isoform X1 [Lingula anatina]|uniref:Histidine N-acetyltransferase isoform X1 n=1 Tax=Lingula anatina TaxID=7574 RepID=A0A1S3H3L5_LINAN|nr:histidine N-acetyltransferase isoform X1 [Lingula anatina]|eukprot:XP_013380593.1 histidine N-acetyltransferase isoform X1 [Lingula anatina]
MDTAMDDLIIRCAALEDFDAVLGINDHVYEGLDYLPDCYPRYLTSPHITAYLAELKGEAVAFCIAHVNDDATTLVLRAGRVKPTHQKHGIAERLVEFIIKEERAKHPGLRKRRDIEFASEGKPVKMPLRMVEISRRKLFCFGALTTHIKCSEIAGVNKISAADWLSSGTTATMFPDGVVINGVPYSILPSNAEQIENESDLYVSNGTAELTSGCFSAVTRVRCPRVGLRVLIDIYGRGAALYNHICCHVNNTQIKAKELNIGNVFVQLFVDENFPVGELKENVYRLGLEDRKSFFGHSVYDVLLLEEKL